MKTTTRRDIVDVCKACGIMLIDQGDCVSIDAPTGYTLMGNNLHSSTIHTIGWRKHEIYEALMFDIGGGLEKCDNPDCDNCVHEPYTFEQLEEMYRGERLA